MSPEGVLSWGHELLLCDSAKHAEDASEMQDESEGKGSQSGHWGSHSVGRTKWKWPPGVLQ